MGPTVQEVPLDGVGLAGLGLDGGPEEGAGIGAGKVHRNVVVLLVHVLQFAGSVLVVHDDGVLLGALPDLVEQAILQMLVGHVVHVVVQPLKLGLLLLRGDVGAPLGLLLLLQVEDVPQEGLQQILEAPGGRDLGLVHCVEVLLLADGRHFR